MGNKIGDGLHDCSNKVYLEVSLIELFSLIELSCYPRGRERGPDEVMVIFHGADPSTPYKQKSDSNSAVWTLGRRLRWRKLP
jgi:hypothetical protein